MFLAPGIPEICLAYLLSANDSVPEVIKLSAPPSDGVFCNAASAPATPEKSCGGQAVRRDVAINCACKIANLVLFREPQENFKRRGHRDYPGRRFQVFVVGKSKSYPFKRTEQAVNRAAHF